MSRSMVIPWVGDHEGIGEVLSELLNGSDRTVAVVGGALVDELLARVVRYALRTTPDAPKLCKAVRSGLLDVSVA